LQGDTLFNQDILIDIKNELNDQHHHQNIKSIFLRGNCKLSDKLEIEHKIGELLWESGLKILRIKGIICL
jgi:G3E family GTPase